MTSTNSEGATAPSRPRLPAGPTAPSGKADATTEEWRHLNERGELVEALIESQRQVSVLQRTLREYAEHVGDDRSDGSYATALQARIVILEANIEKLTRRKDAA